MIIPFVALIAVVLVVIGFLVFSAKKKTNDEKIGER